MYVKRINKSRKRGVQRYTYYTAGQRVKKTVGATTSLFMYDEGGQLLGKYDGAGNALYETVYLDEQPVAVAQTRCQRLQGVYLYADHLNSPG